LTTSKIDKNKVFINAIIRLTQLELREFRKYTFEIESKFESEKNRLADSYEDAIKDVHPDDRRDIAEIISEEHYMIEEIYLGIYRKSTLVSIYSYLENSLNNLCRRLYKKQKYPIKYTDLRGKGIERAKNYLKKLNKVDFDPLNTEWSHLNALNKIRNCIVHSEGDIKYYGNREEINTLAEHNPHLSIKDDRYLKVSRKYVDNCITTTEEFLVKLYHQVFSK